MIKGVSPGENRAIPIKRAGAEEIPKKEQEIPPPSDSSVISAPTEKITKELMRKASIEYYPLHVRREEKPTDEGKTPSDGKSEELNPKYISVLSEDSAKKILQKGYDVGPFEKKLQAELGPYAKIQNEWDIQGLDGNIPTTTELQELFKQVIADKSVPWEYIIDGCYARSHKTCEKFLDANVNVAKLYIIIADAHPDDPSYPFPPWRLKAKNKFMEGEWWYHVAAIVFAKDDQTGEIEGLCNRSGNKQRASIESVGMD